MLNGKDTLALLPTGGGKSICYQVPGLILPGTALVVTPLIALMKDQVEQLTSRGVKAAYIHSGLTKRELHAVLENALYGAYQFVYLSPERFRSAEFLKYLQGIKVSLLAIDEAHCISQWGFDFRPAYLELENVSEIIGDKVPKIALTATATPKVVEDIKQYLQLKDPAHFQQSYTRTNLNYLFVKDEGKRGRMLKALQRIPGCAIVYTRNRRATSDIVKFLNSEGISSDFYHAGLDFESRGEKQNRWMSGETRVMVATNAFGMGIDKPDVRQVIHFQIPDSIEAYYQEAGRAGRDNKESWCTLLYDDVEIANAKERLAKKYPELEEVERVYHAMCNYYQISFHSGQGRTLDFELLDFCGKFKLSPAVVHSSLQLLSKLNLVQLSDGASAASRLKITLEQHKLYDYQLRNPHHDQVLKLLLRSYGGLFDHYISIDEWALSKRLNINKQALKKTLIQLAKAQVLEYFPRKEKPYITFLSSRVQTIDFSPSWVRNNPKREEERLNSILAILDNPNQCREKAMLDYFGESMKEDCGRCDVCRKRIYGKSKSQSFLNIAELIEQELREESRDLSALIESLPSVQEDLLMETLRKLIDEQQVLKDKKGLLHWQAS